VPPGLKIRGKKAVSEAVKVFSSQVDNTIKSHNGLTVYAGGDDVLALLPLDKALPAAAQLRGKYMEAFQDFNKPEDTTISAAIVYAHHHAPLKQVIAKAHQILDEDAKERSGRDALAVTVWKTGGAVINWSVPWELKTQDGDLVSIDFQLNKLLLALGNKKLTNSWIYNIRKVFQEPLGSDFKVPEGIDLQKLLSAELMRSREIDLSSAQAEEIVNDLLTLCCYQWRDNKKQVQRDDSKFSLSGALLVKFLVTRGAKM
jgi:CRISPR-associated protein Cmr2